MCRIVNYFNDEDLLIYVTQAARVQQARKAAAHDWRATLSAEKDKLSNEQGLPQTENKHGGVKKSEETNEEKVFEQQYVDEHVQETVQRDRCVDRHNTLVL